MGWRGSANFLNYADMPEIRIMGLFGKQSSPFEGPDATIQRAVQSSSYKHNLFGETIDLLSKSIDHFREGEAKIASGSKTEWEYLVGKTEQFVLHLETIRTLLAAYIQYDKSFEARSRDEKDFLNQLEASESLFYQARNQSRVVAAKIAGKSTTQPKSTFCFVITYVSCVPWRNFVNLSRTWQIFIMGSHTGKGLIGI
jgi:hypothetical protein